MGKIVDIFKEIFYQGKEGMGLQEEGLEDEKMAAQLLVFDHLLTQISDYAKVGKKIVKERREILGDELNAMRNNPNASLSDFEEMPKSTEIKGDITIFPEARVDLLDGEP